MHECKGDTAEAKEVFGDVEAVHAEQEKSLEICWVRNFEYWAPDDDVENMAGFR